MKQFFINKLYAEVYKDNYQKGELKHVNGWEYKINTLAIDLPGLLSSITEEIGFNVADPNNYQLTTDMNYPLELCASFLVNVDNEEPTRNELRAWKQGKIDLYSLHISGEIKIFNDVTEEASKTLSLAQI